MSPIWLVPLVLPQSTDCFIERRQLWQAVCSPLGSRVCPTQALLEGTLGHHLEPTHCTRPLTLVLHRLVISDTWQRAKKSNLRWAGFIESAKYKGISSNRNQWGTHDFFLKPMFSLLGKTYSVLQYSVHRNTSFTAILRATHLERINR